jgi:hypothetical protein
MVATRESIRRWTRGVYPIIQTHNPLQDGLWGVQRLVFWHF